ncbi:uncharacterized protein EDB93DRAFT_1083595 [Suillus bovinus]|uniref:uncharacterized protein n=1 Tax=Suillus bovinus TaxID=48563 RepID=UPI001B86212D|nr:uncharacterized protein EDB93DRAFT_1083595 [Suillus bovinus]KAG2151101.1 hypothetical protein EDB93DRAFT_1083595 [Suillus bovinus]
MSSPAGSIIASPSPQNNDEDDDDVEWELQNNGLYIGSYSRIVLMNALVPIFAIVVFTVLAFLPDLAWPIADFPSPYPSSFPFPLPQILISSAFFSLTHLLRVPLFSLAFLLLPSDYASFASTFIHILITNGLRLASLVILQVRHTMDYPIPTCQDPAFRTVWWLSLNFAEVLAAIVQGYQQLALYRDLMVPEGRETEFLERIKSGSLDEPEPVLANPHSPQQEHDTFGDALEDGEARSVESRIDRGLEKLLVIKMRDELEEVYGLPVIKIPVFISCLQRFNSIFLSIGLTLLLSAAYLRSPLSVPLSDISGQLSFLPVTDQLRGFLHATSHTQSYDSSYIPLIITAPLVLLLHTSLAVLHTPTFLPRIGVHTAAYVGVLVGIMTFFAGLAVWGALS